MTEIATHTGTQSWFRKNSCADRDIMRIYALLCLEDRTWGQIFGNPVL